MNYGYASESGNAPVSFSYSQLEKEGVAVEGQKFPDKRYGSYNLMMHGRLTLDMRKWINFGRLRTNFSRKE